MSETHTTIGPLGVDAPLRFGATLGAVLAVVQRFLFQFELTVLGVALLVVGAVVARFGERWWVDAGRALVAVGVVGVLAFQVLVLVFG